MDDTFILTLLVIPALLAETRAAARRGFASEPVSNATSVSPPALGRP